MNQEIVAWCAAIAAVAFVIVCGFLVSVLRTAKRSLSVAQSTLQEVKETVEGMQKEIKQLSGSISSVTDTVNDKLRSTDPIFQAVHDAGLLIGEVTGAAREVAHSFRQQASAAEDSNALPGWMQWAVLGSRLVKETLILRRHKENENTNR